MPEWWKEEAIAPADWGRRCAAAPEIPLLNVSPQPASRSAVIGLNQLKAGTEPTMTR